MSPAAAPMMSWIAPFFIVRDVGPTVAFYRDRLGFEVLYLAPDPEPFFAIVQCGDARLILKAIAEDVPPLPNWRRHPWARWDAYVHVADPDALGAEVEARGGQLRAAVADTDDGLRGFEVEDPDGHVLFFGRPR